MLRYPGGKTRAIKVLEQHLPECGIDEIVSPFFGGGSFELAMSEKFSIPVFANDKFQPLFNFWNVLKQKPNELHGFIKSHMPVSKEDFQYYKQLLYNPEISVIEQAAYYYIINRCSFSGSTCSGGYSKESAEKRHTMSALNRMLTIDLSRLIFTNEDFTTFLGRYSEEFLFLDPPYYLGNQSNLYGTNGDLHELFDHHALYHILTTKPKWMLCYNDCEYIREKYSSYNIREVKWTYGMNKSKKSKEVLITSYS